jgi:hypothetical protein
VSKFLRKCENENFRFNPSSGSESEESIDVYLFEIRTGKVYHFLGDHFDFVTGGSGGGVIICKHLVAWRGISTLLLIDGILNFESPWLSGWPC